MYKIIMFTLLMCNMLAISSISWISLWMLMEITTYLFLTSSIDQMKMSNKLEFLLTYFLVSFISSAMFLISLITQSENSMNMLNYDMNKLEMNTLQFMILSIAFMLKIGSIPFHPWVFSVMENLKWKTMMTLTTIQKIIPIWALTFFSSSLLMTLIISISMVVIMFIPLKTKSMFYFMATSATNNIIWIFFSMMADPLTVLIYSTIYFILTINLITNFKKNNMKMLNQNFYSLGMMISIFSLMGIPPLLGFIPKLNTITSITMTSGMMMFMLVMMVISNSITTIMYMKPLMPSLVLSLNKITNKTIQFKSNFLMSSMIHLSWPIMIPIIYIVN